jgi:hypothetical protein
LEFAPLAAAVDASGLEAAPLITPIIHADVFFSLAGAAAALAFCAAFASLIRFDLAI